MRALRWLAGRRALEPFAARLLCARTVRESTVFFTRETRRPRGVYLYTLRENGLRVAIRHVGVDAAVLAEVFHQRYYHPPAEVSRAIGEPRAILDLGANIGLFGAFAIRRWPEAQIVAYEPDPENAAVHGQTVAVNGLSGRWTLERAAAGTRNGQVRFAAGLDAGSHIIDGQTDAAGTEVTVPQHDVLPRMANAELVKMDIEGGEWPILHDPRFVQDPPSALVLEYHPRSCPGIDPHAVASDALARAGLRTALIWRLDDGHGMVWAWRRSS